MADTTPKSRSVLWASVSVVHRPVLEVSEVEGSAADSIEAASGAADSEGEVIEDSEADEAAWATEGEEGPTATQTTRHKVLAVDTAAAALASTTEVRVGTPISNPCPRGPDTTTATARTLALAVGADRSGRMRAAVGIMTRVAVGDVIRTRTGKAFRVCSALVSIGRYGTDELGLLSATRASNLAAHRQSIGFRREVQVQDNGESDYLLKGKDRLARSYGVTR